MRREIAITEPCPICNGKLEASPTLNAAMRQDGKPIGSVVVLSATCKSCGRRFRKQTAPPNQRGGWKEA